MAYIVVYQYYLPNEITIPYKKFFIKIKKKLVNWNILVTNINNSIRDFDSSGERKQTKIKTKILEKRLPIVCY